MSCGCAERRERMAKWLKVAKDRVRRKLMPSVKRQPVKS